MLLLSDTISEQKLELWFLANGRVTAATSYNFFFYNTVEFMLESSISVSNAWKGAVSEGPVIM